MNFSNIDIFEAKLISKINQCGYSDNEAEKSSPSKKAGKIYFYKSKDEYQKILTEIKGEDEIQSWQIADKNPLDPGIFPLQGKNGPVWLVNLNFKINSGIEPIENIYDQSKELSGSLFCQIADSALPFIYIKFLLTDEETILGSLVGIDCAFYQYKQSPAIETKLIFDRKIEPFIEKTVPISSAVNISRHLVNTPPNILNPESYETIAKNIFSKFDSIKINVLKDQALIDENLNLLAAVGKGSETVPRLIHLSYKPKKPNKNKTKPQAFIGKGVTFDSGGLDIKSGSGMRLMKKDMAGSSAVFALAYWCATSDYEVPCEFYLPLAENSVSSNSYRPSDIITARNGLNIEIHNTDAEGRLVMADALHYAVTRPQKPESVIDISTLTGSMKIALGTEIGGLFSNNKILSQKLLKASQDCGDHLWPMPLGHRYSQQLESSCADLTNASTSKFAGAITAALFLEYFVEDTPWAHLDIMAWSDKAKGYIGEQGANGQGVQCLIQYLDNLASS